MRAGACFALLLVGRAAAHPLPNADFEEGETSWQIQDSDSRVTPEAAHSGSQGLRVGAPRYYPSGSSVHSAKFPVTPGQKIGISFWGRTTAANAGVYAWYSNTQGKPLGGSPPAFALADSKGEWRSYAFETTVPERAAYVDLWIHSFAGSDRTADVDDFALTGIAPDATPLPPPPTKRTAPAAVLDPNAIPERKTPPVIVLKFDDVKPVRGSIPERWKNLAVYLEKRAIKGGFGVICNTLTEATPACTAWFAERQKAGQIEFWFHGYDHGTHDANGVLYNEFNGRSYEEQHARVSQSQALAKEKLGFAFTTFGPPGGVYSDSLNADTLRAMAEDPDIRVVLYPKPLDDAGKQAEATGKLTILDRVWAINLESAVGVPDFQRFLAGYAANPERPYFVLQGHPAMWDENRFAEFERIIDFLTAHHAVFMTPTACAESMRNKRL